MGLVLPIAFKQSRGGTTSSLLNGLEHYWDLTGVDATGLADAHGAWNLTNGGAATASAGTGPGGRDVIYTPASAGGYVDAGNRAWSSPGDLGLTISVWAKLSGYSSTGNWLFSWRGSNWDTGLVQISPYSNSTNAVIALDTPNRRTPSDPTAAGTGVWHHFVLTNSETAARLWLNGTEVASDSTALSGLNASTMPLRLGAASWGDNPDLSHNGELALCGIWNRALSATEVGQLYNAGSGLDYSELPSPIPTTGLALWLDAAEGVTEEGSGVSVWADQSGNGNNLTQTTDASRPVITPASLNGLPAITFDGTDDFLIGGSPIVSTSSTIFIVTSSNNVGSFDQFENEVAFSTTGSVGTDRHQVWFRRTIAGTGKGQFAGYGGATISTTANELNSGQHYLVSFVGDDAGLIRVDSAEEASGASGGNVFGTPQLGQWNDANYLDGNICECVVYNRALSTAEITQVETYLNNKYLFSPIPITGLALWLDAAEGVTEVGSGVDTWADQSGIGFDLTQTTDGSRPSLTASSINGLPAVTFDGVDEFLIGDTVTDYGIAVPETNGHTLFIVYKPALVSGNAPLCNNYNTANPNYNLGSQAHQAANCRAGNTNSPNITMTQDTDPHLLTRLMRDDTTYSGWQDGILQGTETLSISGFRYFESDLPMNFGKWGDIASYFEGDIAEIVLYSRELSTAEITEVETYLSTKYGL